MHPSFWGEELHTSRNCQKTEDKSVYCLSTLAKQVKYDTVKHIIGNGYLVKDKFELEKVIQREIKETSKFLHEKW